jgi:glycosyltransferase involved in cell wall biosynthesis
MLVSVLMPFRDAAATLEEAARSILVQRDVTLELVAIDDGSRDDGAMRMARLAARDRRIVLVAGGGVGIAAALNRGLCAARGHFIARMDADDVALPDRLAKQVRLLAQEERLAAVGARVAVVGDCSEGLRRYVAWQNGLISPADHARELFVESPLCHPSVVLRRDALERAGGWRQVAWAEDYDLWLRLDASGWHLAKVPDVLLMWRHLRGRATFTDPRYALGRFVEAKAAYMAPKLARWARPLAIWGAGPTGRRLARALEAHDIRPSLFIDIDPRKIGRLARGVPILPFDGVLPGVQTVVVAVGVRGARALVRAELAEKGFVEGHDFICAA